MDWERIPNNEHAKRAVEVAGVGLHPVFMLAQDAKIAESLAKYASTLGVRVSIVVWPSFSRIRSKNYPIRTVVFKPTPSDLIRLMHGSLGESFLALRERVLEARKFRESARFRIVFDERAVAEDLKKYAMSTKQFTSLLDVSKSLAALENTEKVDLWHWKEALLLWTAVEDFQKKALRRLASRQD